MKNLMTAVMAILSQLNIEHKQTDYPNTLKIRFEGDNSCFLSFISLTDTPEAVCIDTIFPIIVPQEYRGAISGFITRINHQLLVGHFEMEWDNGIIGFKTSIMFGQSPLTLELIKHLIFSNWHISDEYFLLFYMAINEIKKLKKASESISHNKGLKNTKQINENIKRIINLTGGHLN